MSILKNILLNLGSFLANDQVKKIEAEGIIREPMYVMSVSPDVSDEVFEAIMKGPNTDRLDGE